MALGDVARADVPLASQIYRYVTEDTHTPTTEKYP